MCVDDPKSFKCVLCGCSFKFCICIYQYMRLFVAIEIDDGLRDKITGLQTWFLESGIRFVERKHLHITLKFIGEVPDSSVPTIVDALRSVKFSPFEIALHGVGTFLQSNDQSGVVWIGCRGPVDRLALTVSSALECIGIPKDNREFSSHLTVARIAQKPNLLFKRIEALVDVEIGEQNVSSFSLKQSLLTPQGPVYNDVDVFRLGD